MIGIKHHDMKDLYRFCVGDSHIKTCKPCQDYARSASNEFCSMAIVSDGHGGERYFRSNIGSEYAVKITRNAIEEFVKEMNNQEACLFEHKAFTTSESDTEKTNEKINQALRWLFSSIICQWNIAITEHALNNGLTKWELEHVEEKYLTEFENKRKETDSTFEKTYGCTLMAYVHTSSYWFAFQIGDGKCVFLTQSNGKIECNKSIPWDERCFLNKTTSLCDSQAIDGFRFCYQGDGNFPMAVFLGSDGLDDTYGDEEGLYNFYIELYKLILQKGAKEAKKELKRTLPIISQRGSKDDMSIACVYDDSYSEETIKLLIEYQVCQIDKDILDIENQISQLKEKIVGMNDKDNLSSSQQIDLNYAHKNIEKLINRQNLLNDKKAKLYEEI